MADTKITDLTEKTALDASEELLINDGGTDKKVGIDYLSTGLAFMQSGYKSGYYYPQSGTRQTDHGIAFKDRLQFQKTTVTFPTTFTGVSCRVTGAGTSTSVVRMGIYDDSDDGHPGTLVADWGTVDGTTTGTKTITISETLFGTYWLGIVWQGTGSGLDLNRSDLNEHCYDGYVLANPGVAGYLAYGLTESSVSGALPSSATPVLTLTHFPFVYLST